MKTRIVDYSAIKTTNMALRATCKKCDGDTMEMMMVVRVIVMVMVMLRIRDGSL